MRRVLALCAALAFAAPALPAQSPTVIYLVRHAEKVDDSADPELSAPGQVRAAELARVLRDAGVTRVYSTDLKRTRATARPTADERKLPILPYDPRALQPFADTVRTMGGRLLMVGHSNTTPALVRALGGDPGPPIGDGEYDRLYVLTVSPGQPVITIVLRFGGASPAQ